MARKYPRYLFVDEDLIHNSPAGSTGLDYSRGALGPVLRWDLADLVEMASRRWFFGTVLKRASFSIAECRANSSVRPFPYRYLGWSDGPYVEKGLGPASFSASRPDADDAESESLGPASGYGVDMVPSPFDNAYAMQVVRPTSALFGGPMLVFHQGDFLDPDWELPEDWGYDDAEGTVEWKTGGDYLEIPDTMAVSVTRLTVPSETLFASVRDAVYARDLRTGTYSWTDGSARTAQVSVPPYETWYDPAGANYRATVCGVSVRSWGKYCRGADAMHTDNSLTFECDDYSLDDPVPADRRNIQQVAGLLAKVGRSSLTSDTVCIGSGNLSARVVPPLRTSTSWWEDNKLGVGAGGAALEHLSGAVRSGVAALYTPPAVTPNLVYAEFPVEDGFGSSDTPEGWEPGSGYPYGFVPAVPFGASFAHAKEILEKLHRVVLKVNYVRVEFSSSRTTRTTRDYRWDWVSPTSGSRWETSHEWDESSLRLEGWAEYPVGGTSGTSLDTGYGGSIGGFSLYATGRTGTTVESSMETTTFYDDDGVTSDHTWTSRDRRTTKNTVSRLIPVRSDGAYDYTRTTRSSSHEERADEHGTDPPSDDDSGDSTNSFSSHADKEPDKLVPDEILPFVKSAELILVADATTVTDGSRSGTAIGTCTHGQDGETTSYSGSTTHTDTAKVSRKAVSLGSSPTAEFADIDLDALLDEFAEYPDDAAPGGSEAGTEDTVYTDFYGRGSSTGHYKNRSKTIDVAAPARRTLSNVSMFLVVDFDPDADCDLWASDTSSMQAVKAAYDALADARRALEKAQAAKAEADAAKAEADAAKADAQAAYDELDGLGAGGWSARAGSAVADAEAAVAAAEAALAAAEAAFGASESAHAQAEADLHDKEAAYYALPEESRPGSPEEAALAAARAAEQAAAGDMSGKAAAVRGARRALAGAQAALEAARAEEAAGYAAALQAAADALAAAEAAVTDADAAVTDAEAAVTDAEAALAAAEAAYAAAVETAAADTGGWDPDANATRT